MEWIEVSARTLDQAIELALDRLGVVEDELEYVVLEEPRAGLFGIGRTDARIRARVRPVSREKPHEQRRRRARGNGTRRNRPGGTAAPPREAPTGPGAVGAAGPATREDGERAAASPRRRRRRRGGASVGGGAVPGGQPAVATAPVTRTDAHETEAETVEETSTMTLEEQAATARDFTAGLVEAFGLRASVVTEVAGDDDIEVRVSGDGLGVLVGPRGITLQAVEELVRAAVQRAAGGHSARVHLDVAGYRQRRREALAAFAASIAEEVKASGSPRALEPMSPPDRKVVHDTVAAIEGVSTISEGEEPRRRVVITPA